MARFTRTKPAPLVKRPYGDFRPHVRADFEQCCAYCYLHERWAQGQEGFDMDHFYPKGKFPALVNDFYNLYWSCTACNRRKQKGEKWPSEEDLSQGIGFVDLCRDDFEDHFRILPDGHLEGLTASARYTIDTIRLNREHLVEIRAILLTRGDRMDKPPR